MHYQEDTVLPGVVANEKPISFVRDPLPSHIAFTPFTASETTRMYVYMHV